MDYRVIRIARTETAAMLADEQTDIAENSLICDGLMYFVMDRGRDHWNCNCEHYSEQSPWRVDDPERPDILVHPNCMCQWRPHLKTDEEIITQFKEDMKEELETIEGTDWQKEMMERLRTKGRICQMCGYAEFQYNRKYKNAKVCPKCGAGLEVEGNELEKLKRQVNPQSSSGKRQ